MDGAWQEEQLQAPGPLHLGVVRRPARSPGRRSASAPPASSRVRRCLALDSPGTNTANALLTRRSFRSSPILTLELSRENRPETFLGLQCTYHEAEK